MCSTGIGKESSLPILDVLPQSGAGATAPLDYHRSSHVRWSPRLLERKDRSPMRALQNRAAWMTLVVGAIGLLMACAPAGPVQRGQTASESASPSAAAPKTLRMGSIREPVEGIALF